MASPNSLRTIIREQWATKLQLPTKDQNDLNYFKNGKTTSMYVLALYIYGTQYVRIACTLRHWLDDNQATEPPDTVKEHHYSLLQAIRLLHHFCHVSQPVLGPTFNKECCSESLINSMECLLEDILKEATSLEKHLHKFLVPHIRGPYQMIALESLLELSIQCVLDFFQGSFPEASFDIVCREVGSVFCLPDIDPYLIHHELVPVLNSSDFKMLRKIPEKGARFGLPTAIFLAPYNNTVHVGGSKIEFNFRLPNIRRHSLLMGKVFYSLYHEKRRDLLSVLGGASTLVELGSDSKHYVSRGSLNQARLQKLVAFHERHATSRGTRGQSYVGVNFHPLGPCAKCRIIHQFDSSRLTTTSPIILKRYPDLSCAEDLWYLKTVMGKDLEMEE